jgi:Rhomboid family
VNIVASHFLLTALCPVFGTIPVGLAFFVGGISANIMSVAWMGKRGKSVYKEKYPGQFFGILGMSGGNYAVLGFGAAAYPHWYVDVFRVWPVKISYVVIFAWVLEAFQYWRHTGWEKIQSSVQIISLLFC